MQSSTARSLGSVGSMQGRCSQGLEHVLIAVDVPIDGRKQLCLPKMVGRLVFTKFVVSSEVVIAGLRI